MTEENKPEDYFGFNHIPQLEQTFKTLSDGEIEKYLNEIAQAEVQSVVSHDGFGVPQLNVSLPHGCRVYGVAGIKFVSGYEEDTVEYDPKGMWLEEIYVPSRFWGNGIAKRLVNGFLEGVREQFPSIDHISGKTPNVHAMRSIYSSAVNNSKSMSIFSSAKNEQLMEYINGSKRDEFIPGRPFGDIQFKIDLK